METINSFTALFYKAYCCEGRSRADLYCIYRRSKYKYKSSVCIKWSNNRTSQTNDWILTNEGAVVMCHSAQPAPAHVFPTFLLCVPYTKQVHIRRGRVRAAAITAHFHTQTLTPTPAVVFSLSQARIFWRFPAMMSYCDNAFWLAYLPSLSSSPVGIIFTQAPCIFFKSRFMSLWTSYVLTLKNRCSLATLSCLFSLTGHRLGGRQPLISRGSCVTETILEINQ